MHSEETTPRSQLTLVADGNGDNPHPAVYTRRHLVSVGSDVCRALPRGRSVTQTPVGDCAQRLHALFIGMVDADVDAVCVADKSVSTWREIQTALAPIVGSGGAAALFQHSVYLVRTDFPWLAAAPANAHEPGAYATLQATLLRQTGACAAQANAALLRTFCESLTSLIGAALGERLLRPICTSVCGDAAILEKS